MIYHGISFHPAVAILQVVNMEYSSFTVGITKFEYFSSRSYDNGDIESLVIMS